MAGLNSVVKWAVHLERGADGMTKDGVGGATHNSRSHISLIRRIASAMRTDHANGIVPHEFVDTAPRYYGSADATLSAAAAAATASSAVAAAMGGLKDDGLPSHISAVVKRANLELPTSGPVSAAVIEKSSLEAGDRIVLKHTLAALGRLVA